MGRKAWRAFLGEAVSQWHCLRSEIRGEKVEWNPDELGASIMSSGEQH